MGTLNAVIFDLDGLMFDTESLAIAAWIRAGANRGIQLSEELLTATIGLRACDTESLLGARLDPDVPVRELAAMADDFVMEYIGCHGLAPKPGLLPMLDWLEHRRIPKAVGTSSASFLARAKLQAGGVAGRFEAIACGDEVVHGKPSPDVFLLASARLGIRPDRCLVLEDSIPGVDAAHAAGMHVVQIPERPKGEAGESVLVARSLDAVLTMLQKGESGLCLVGPEP